MPSTFFGLNIASSALNAFQVAVNTTANNISNVQTKGYTKQTANRQATEGLRVYQRYGTVGSGVTTVSITSARDNYYDAKYWKNQAFVGFYDTKLNYLKQIENYYVDDGTTQPGFKTLFTNMFNAMNSLSSSDGDDNKRKAFIGQAEIFTSYFHDVSNGLSRIQKDCDEQIKALVDSINASSQKIATLTKQINIIELEGGTANELRDQRALVIDDLSDIVPITVVESPVTNSNYPDMYLGGTNYVVKLDGQVLVDSFEYRTLACVTREEKVNQTDVDELYDVVWADTGMNFNVNADSMSGSLKALIELRDGNNAENFKGRVVNASNAGIKIKPDTMTSIESMTMASEGMLTIQNRAYHYTGFQAELDENGKVTSYLFQLDPGTDASTLSGVTGKAAQIGVSVDAMGIPYYMSQMSEFLRSFTERFNAYQQGGMDLNGDPMGSFFTAKRYDGFEYTFTSQKVNTNGVTDKSSVISSSSNCYYQMTALNIQVAEASVRDSSKFATSANIIGGNVDAHEIIDEMGKLEDEVKLFRGGGAASFLACIYSDITIDANEAKSFQENFTSIESAITNQRLSIAGVDEDEEALDIVKFQNAYNLASRMVRCMTELYDKLINETGV